MNGNSPAQAGPASRVKHFLYRVLIQMVRLALIALFLYITYLGFVWRKLPHPKGAPSAPPPAASR